MKPPPKAHRNDHSHLESRQGTTKTESKTDGRSGRATALTSWMTDGCVHETNFYVGCNNIMRSLERFDIYSYNLMDFVFLGDQGLWRSRTTLLQCTTTYENKTQQKKQHVIHYLLTASLFESITTTPRSACHERSRNNSSKVTRR